MQRVTGQDAMFLYAETNEWHMLICALLVLDPGDKPLDVARLRATIVARLPSVPQFRWRLQEVLGGWQKPLWVEASDFDPRDHIRVVTVPAPGDESDLFEIFGALASRKLHRDRPLWEMWVVEGMRNGKAALMFKAHHALTDGISGVELAKLLLDFTPDAAVTEREEPIVDHAPPLVREIIRGAIEGVVQAPIRTLRFALNTARSAESMLRHRRGGGGPVLPLIDAPRTALNGSVGAQRQFTGVSVPLERIMDLKAAHSVTVNDVLLAMTAGALRTYLGRVATVPDRPLVAAVPINLRGDRDRADAGSRVAWMFVGLPVHLDDPGLRLRATSASAVAAKALRNDVAHHHGPKLGDVVAPVGLRLIGRFGAALSLGDAIPPGINMLVSNIPGPPMPMYVAGARVDAIYPVGPLMMGYGLNLTALSYNGHMHIGLLSCPTKVRDGPMLGDLFAEELAALEGVAPN